MSGTNGVFINSYNEESNDGYFLEVDVQYPKKFHELLNNLPFLPDRMKIEKVENLATNLLEIVIHTKNLKQALNHGLILKKVHRGIKLNQKA